MTEKVFNCDGARQRYDKLALSIEQDRPSIIEWDDEQAGFKESPLPGPSPVEGALELIVQEADRAGHGRCLGKSACQIALGGQAQAAGAES